MIKAIESLNLEKIKRIDLSNKFYFNGEEVTPIFYATVCYEDPDYEQVQVYRYLCQINRPKIDVLCVFLGVNLL